MPASLSLDGLGNTKFVNLSIPLPCCPGVHRDHFLLRIDMHMIPVFSTGTVRPDASRGRTPARIILARLACELDAIQRHRYSEQPSAAVVHVQSSCVSMPLSLDPSGCCTNFSSLKSWSSFTSPPVGLLVFLSPPAFIARSVMSIIFKRVPFRLVGVSPSPFSSRR